MTDEKFNCSAFDFKTGQKRDLENHNKSMHEQPHIIEKLKTLSESKTNRLKG